MSITKHPFSCYIQDNQLYNAETHTLDQFDNGLLHYIDGYHTIYREYEECHGPHLIETTESNLKCARTMVIENGEIKQILEHTFVKEQMEAFEKVFVLLIKNGVHE